MSNGSRPVNGARRLIGAVAPALLASLITALPASASPEVIEPSVIPATGTVSPGDRFGVPAADKHPEPEAARDRVLVRFHESASEQERGRALGRHGLSRGKAVGRTGFVVAKTHGRDPDQARKGLRKETAVAAVTLDYQRDISVDPADSLATHDRDTWNRSQYAETRVQRAWQVTSGASDLIIAVVDTGVRASHQELTGRVLTGRNFVSGGSNASDDNGHGTFVASIAAADMDGGDGIVGVAGTSKILPVKVLNRDGAGYDSHIASGITWAADQGADVINLSLGGPGASSALESAVSYAHSKGSLVIAAAGNNGSGTPLYPAAVPDVLAVGATGYGGELAYFSSYGEHIDLTAPGVELWGAGIAGDSAYVRHSGTSFSAPFVSGVAALVMTRERSMSADQVAARLRTTATDVGPPGIDPYYGWGLVDAAAALGEWVANPRPPAVDRGFGGDDYPAGAAPLELGTTTLASGDDWAWYRWTADSDRLDLAVTPSPPSSDVRDGRGIDPVVVVLDRDLRVLTYLDNGLVFEPETVGLGVTQGELYYVAVGNYHGSAGSYRMEAASGGSAPGASGGAWVRQMSPDPRSGDLTGGSDFQVWFARSVQADSITADTVRILDGVTGVAISASRAYDAGTGLLTVAPTGKLLPNRSYRLHIAGVRDSAGNTLSGLRVPASTGGIGRGFTARQPVRVLDTRSGIGAPAARIGPGGHLDLRIAGTNGVPANADAVVLNVAAVQPTRSTYLAVTPTPADAAAPPTTASLNLEAGEIRANQVTVKVGAEGGVRVYNHSGEIDVVADLSGWYADNTGAGFEPLPPARILDTRSGLGAPKARVGSDKHIDLLVRGRGGVPSGATGVVFNLAGVAPSRDTFLAATPKPLVGVAEPSVSSVNLRAGEIVPNLVSVPIGANGRVRLYNRAGTIDLVADVVGYFSPYGRSAFVPVDPVRLLDTRDGSGVLAGTIGGGEHRDLAVAGNPALGADSVSAVAFNVAGVQPTVATWIAALPTPASGSALPSTSTLNLAAGEIRSNAAITRIGHQGKVRLFNHAGDVHVVADAVGYFRDVGYGA